MPAENDFSLRLVRQSTEKLHPGLCADRLLPLPPVMTPEPVCNIPMRLCLNTPPALHHLTCPNIPVSYPGYYSGCSDMPGHLSGDRPDTLIPSSAPTVRAIGPGSRRTYS